jgi:predicted lipid-binding transport protein (Tim44 family)
MAQMTETFAKHFVATIGTLWGIAPTAGILIACITAISQQYLQGIFLLLLALVIIAMRIEDAIRTQKPESGP